MCLLYTIIWGTLLSENNIVDFFTLVIDIDECVIYSICEHNCSNINGSYQCSCLDGYTLVNNTNCEDIDECNATDIVDGCQNCRNTPGSFDCSCFDGYVLNSTTLFHCHSKCHLVIKQIQAYKTHLASSWKYICCKNIFLHSKIVFIYFQSSL